VLDLRGIRVNTPASRAAVTGLLNVPYGCYRLGDVVVDQKPLDGVFRAAFNHARYPASDRGGQLWLTSFAGASAWSSSSEPLRRDTPGQDLRWMISSSGPA
jgi:hypothetical protein